MKKGFKIAIAVGCALLALGIVMILISSVLGGSVSWNTTGKVEAASMDIDEPFSAVEVNEISADVKIKLSTDQRCHIEFGKSEREPLEIKVRDGILTLERKNKHKLFFISLGVGLQEMDPTVLYLPESTYQTICVQTVSGDIALESGLSVETVELSCVSGDIQVGELTPKAISLECVSGSITLEDVCADKKLSCQTTSGDILLTRCDAQEIVLESVSGDLLSGLRTAKQVNTDTVSGTVTAPPAQNANGTLRAETVSGDITIHMP